MFTYPKKAKDTQSRSMSSNLDKRDKGKRAFQLEDNRPEVNDKPNLSNLVSSISQAKTKTDIGSIHRNSVAQRHVPGDGTPFKPQANTGSYRARGGQDTTFSSTAHTRARFGFGTNTRYEVFERYNPTMQGNRIVSIRASNGEQVNVEGIQLDHQISWDRISTEMDRKNNDGTNQTYSFWDAKMYYNDIDNLVPAMGGLNAAAGARGVAVEPRLNSTIEAAAGAVQHSWMNLQHVMSALNSGQGYTQISDEEMTNLLLDINGQLSGLASKLLGN